MKKAKEIMRFIIPSSLVAGSYFKVSKKLGVWLYHKSPLAPYIYKGDWREWKDGEPLAHKIQHFLYSHCDDVLGAVGIAWLGDELLRYFAEKTGNDNLRKYATTISSFGTAAFLSMTELLQKYHLFPGTYDKEDLMYYLAGSLAYFVGRRAYSIWKKSKEKEKNDLYKSR